ncbi:putative salt-induced outer membrane protein [Natronospira proteinivora]|uniref:Salt-induced outer membrane protein n=1 Tax=Natronospira proteinivora TaxID=1807133 RepID=A0ABT1G8B7_9GAMM|nr:DUF481 domain-containing protein [Natronospira proteinivora]MCP1727539.1 putative salt-induced outer membrane protein [Natronospira proteinivora]
MSNHHLECPLRYLSACILLACSSPLLADSFSSDDHSIFGSVVDDAPDRSDVDMEEQFMEWGYGGRIEVGYQARSGNTDRTDLNSRLILGAEKGAWGHSFEARAVSATADEETAEERYYLATKSEYDVSERDYFFGAVNGEKDRIRNIDRQTTEALGYGRRLVATENTRLDAEVGLGARQVRFRDGTPNDSDRIIRLASDFSWDINSKASLSQDIRIESGLGDGDRTFGESITSFSAALVGELALNLSYTVRYVDDPALDLATRTDTITSVGLNYKF